MVTITGSAAAKLPTKYGEFICRCYEDSGGGTHLALIKGDVKTKPVYVRVHSQCLTGDTLGSCRCDCGPQLDAALKKIAAEGGVLLYMQQEGRGIGLANKIKAYALQDSGMDTVEANEKLGFSADQRDYTVGAMILADIGVTQIKLLTNNPRKIVGLEKYNLHIAERIPLIIEPTEQNRKYLQTKKEKLGHLFEEKGVVK